MKRQEQLLKTLFSLIGEVKTEAALENESRQKVVKEKTEEEKEKARQDSQKNLKNSVSTVPRNCTWLMNSKPM